MYVCCLPDLPLLMLSLVLEAAGEIANLAQGVVI